MRQASRYIILLLTTFAWVLPCHMYGSNPEESAKAYFDSGDYEEALNVWEGLIVSGRVTAGNYYNIGLAQSRLGNSAKAMVAFEKALRLKPFNQQILEAISQEKNRMTNGVIPVQPFFLQEWVTRLLTLFRPGYWAILGLLLLILPVFQYLRKIRSNAPVINDSSTKSSSIIIAVGLLFLCLAFLSYKRLYRDNEAIIHSSCEIRQAPDDGSPLQLQIEPGEKIIILDQIEDWYNVRLVNLEEGWIRKECFSLIIIGNP